MSQESKCSSAHRTSSSVICSSCREVIIDHAYSVQRRRIRVPFKDATLNDAFDSSHAGVILGPEFDMYCPTCYSNLPTIKELINANKSSIESSETNDQS